MTSINEPWRTDAESGFPLDIHDAAGHLVARCYDEAHAARIVAGVNCCVGLSNIAIHNINKISDGIVMRLGEQRDRIIEVEKQRDKLITALETIMSNDPYHVSSYWHVARSALVKVRGGAA